MTKNEINDYFYVCSLIEYIARVTQNHRGYIIEQIGKDGIEKLLRDADVNHCLSFEQVGDEVISEYKISSGDFDTISNCKYTVPNYQDIGKLYCLMIDKCAQDGDKVQELIDIFSSFISDEISDFSTGLYYQNPDYLQWSYKEGRLLE